MLSFLFDSDQTGNDSSSATYNIVCEQVVFACNSVKGMCIEMDVLPVLDVRLRYKVIELLVEILAFIRTIYSHRKPTI